MVVEELELMSVSDFGSSSTWENLTSGLITICLVRSASQYWVLLGFCSYFKVPQDFCFHPKLFSLCIMSMLGAKIGIWVLAFQGMSRYRLSWKITLKEGSPGLSVCPRALCGNLRSTVLALKISQLGPSVIITSQESGRQGTYRLTACTVKWVWIPRTGDMSVVVMRALPMVSPSPFICISKTEPWRELKWGRVLAVSLRMLFLICTRLLGKAEKRWPQEEAIQYTNFSFLRKWSTEPVFFKKFPPDMNFHQKNFHQSFTDW